jgi:hypothetical protein
MYPVSELIVISVKGSEPLYPLPLCSHFLISLLIYRPNYFATVCQQDVLFEVNRILCYSFFSSNCALFLLFYDSKTVGVILSYGSPNGLIQQQQEIYFGNNGAYIWKQVRIEPQKSIWTFILWQRSWFVLKFIIITLHLCCRLSVVLKI